MELYDWQKEIRDHEGDITIRAGRQCGKSEGVAERILKIAEEFPGSKHLVIAASERQEGYLREKVERRLGIDYKFRQRKLKSHLPLKNGTDIYIFPVGVTGIYVEGLSSVDFLHADEAIHIKKRVWDSILPMLAEPKKRGLGWMTLSSSTQRKKPEGLFYDSFHMKQFKKIIVRGKDCPHISIEFLEQEKERLGVEKFGVIYNAEWDWYADRYFDKKVVKNAAVVSWNIKMWDREKRYFLGIDPARFGRNEAAFVSSEIDKEFKNVLIIHWEVMKKSSMVELRKKTEEFDKKINYSQILVDDGGVGGGLIDIMEEKFKRRLKPINNKERGKEFKIAKEDLYSNFNKLLEEGKLKIPKDKKFIDDILRVEVDEEGKIKGTDISEAAVRAVWPVKEKKYKVKLV